MALLKTSIMVKNMHNLAKQFGAALLVTAFTSQGAYAGELTEADIVLDIEGRAPISVPLCFNHKGEVVKYWIRTDMDDLATAGYAEQEFFDNNGASFKKYYPFIALNDNTINYYSDLEIKFVVEHECGHQAEGHIETSEAETDPNQTIQDFAQEELDADCYAVKKLRNIFTRQTLISTFARLFPDPAKGPKYADLATRTNKALACFNP